MEAPGSQALDGPVGMADPSTQFCSDHGGRPETRKVQGGVTGGGVPWFNDVGVCVFPDGSECEQWKFYRGECAPAGGMSPFKKVAIGAGILTSVVALWYFMARK
jgi:putative hemolysin